MCLVWTIWNPRNIWNYFFPAYLLCITKVDNLYSEGEVIKITKWLWKSNKKREENFWLSSDMLYYAENYNLPLTVYIIFVRLIFVWNYFTDTYFGIFQDLFSQWWHFINLARTYLRDCQICITYIYYVHGGERKNHCKISRLPSLFSLQIIRQPSYSTLSRKKLKKTD